MVKETEIQGLNRTELKNVYRNKLILKKKAWTEEEDEKLI